MLQQLTSEWHNVLWTYHLISIPHTTPLTVLQLSKNFCLFQLRSSSLWRSWLLHMSQGYQTCTADGLHSRSTQSQTASSGSLGMEVSGSVQRQRLVACWGNKARETGSCTGSAISQAVTAGQIISASGCKGELQASCCRPREALKCTLCIPDCLSEASRTLDYNYMHTTLCASLTVWVKLAELLTIITCVQHFVHPWMSEWS